MNISQPVRFGIVGAGAISHSYAQAFESCAIAQVMGVADTNVSAASALADRLKCKSYSSFGLMADEADLCLLYTSPSPRDS